MSIREILTQCHFAEQAFRNLDPKAKANKDIVFSSIHSFLSHCAMVSKLLKADAESLSIEQILGFPKSSPIHNRLFRNHLEHYDDRLKKWIREKGIDAVIETYNIGAKSVLNVPNVIFISHYDPNTTTFTFVEEDLDLTPLWREINRIRALASAWVKRG